MKKINKQQVAIDLIKKGGLTTMKSNYNKENHEMRYTLNKAINIALKDRNGEKTTDDIVIVMNDESGTTVYNQGHGKRITEYLIQTACKIFARSESQDFMETIADEPCDTEEFCTAQLNDIISSLIDAFANNYKETLGR